MKKSNANKSKTVPKLGIYIPESRVNEVETYRDQMNFSAIFWSAFDSEKHRLDCIPKGKEMNKVVERLRKSKKADEECQRSEGQTCGADWAANRAEHGELLKLRELLLWSQREYDLEVTSLGVQDIFPEFDFWETALRDDGVGVTDAFAEGFVESAVEVLDQAERDGL